MSGDEGTVFAAEGIRNAKSTGSGGMLTVMDTVLR